MPTAPSTEADLDVLRRVLAEQTARADRAERREKLLEAALEDIHERTMRTLMDSRKI